MNTEMNEMREIKRCTAWREQAESEMKSNMQI